ncbi:RND transporter [Afifella marina DSM 2698]|uniref:Efflux transporter, outer membrane factor (OMF) lipoprotein, NodT family n=2 Tax=Afifella marina TaxID=1080 RepID=A0A1G5P1X6_AFIMA|nr:RND transporter [Afifella marina DSM 2698]MBK1628036.1 RND transporter [Afifella marina]MBK5918230.1 RND transporter [Afifella marina]RAI19333.1 RND transporter [Afifella marina DSM 2698]SCZ43238.1 efflux transporter, outer membrane factor (OMF) lipoprotein, NodT family [Afifella marina DSM 2698]
MIAHPIATRTSYRRGRRTTAAMLLTLPWLAGCMVGPDYQKPLMALPASWSQNGATQPNRPPELAQWWSRLNDPLLDSLIDEAVAGNLDVASAKARIREARASYRQSTGALLPSTDGSGSSQRSKSGGASTGGSNTAWGYKAGFDATWELDLFGGNRRTAEAARYGVDVAEEDLRNTLLTLIGDVASNYVNLRGYQARIALAQRTASSQRETADITRNKFEAGAASSLDVANATGQAASTEATIPSLRTSYAEALHRLGVLTGQAPSALETRLKKSKPIPRPKLPIPTGIPAEILNTRPDVRMAERQLAQYTARVGAAEADRFPSVSLLGNIATSGAQIGDLADHSSIAWSFGPSLSVPLFHGGQLAAAADVARAQRDQYFIAYKSSVLNALEEVENAIVGLSQERIRYGKLATSTQAYRQAADLARTLYKSGSSSFLDVLDAERSLYSAEDALLASRVEITQDYIALQKALGGGWDGRVRIDEPEIVDRPKTRPVVFVQH